MSLKQTDVLIIGAGPSGSVAASLLVQRGFEVTVVEKLKFPRFVIGESLLPRCMDNLQAAGLLEVVEKAGFQRKEGARFNRGQEICDFNFADQYTKGWSWTWQVQRKKFDQLLIDGARDKGAEVLFECEVKNVHINEDGTSIVEVESGGSTSFQIEARFIMDASGYGRVLPRLLELEQPSSLPSRTSFFTHFEEQHRPQDEAHHINILIHQTDVWGWIIPFSDGTSSVGIAGNSSVIDQFDGDVVSQMKKWIDTIPILEKRFSGKFPLFTPNKIKGYSKAVKSLYGNGFVLTGNSSEFLDPVFSSGVTFATETGRVGAELVAKKLNGETVDWQKEYADYINYGIEVFRTYVNKWYEGKLQNIFFSEQKSDTIKPQICSVLAGYVWDTSNPFVHKKDTLLDALASIV